MKKYNLEIQELTDACQKFINGGMEEKIACIDIQNQEPKELIREIEEPDTFLLDLQHLTAEIHIPHEYLRVWSLAHDQSSWMTPMFKVDEIINLLNALYRPLPLALEYKVEKPKLPNSSMNFLYMFNFWKNLRLRN